MTAHSPLIIGVSDGHLFTIAAKTRRRHLHVIGQTGAGKSTLFANLIAQDLAADRGIGLIDPHGSLAQAALSYLPGRRAHELVYLDPADTARPIGFNPLDGIPLDQHPVAADGIVAAFHHVWPDSWGPRLAAIGVSWKQKSPGSCSSNSSCTHPFRRQIVAAPPCCTSPVATAVHTEVLTAAAFGRLF